MSVAGAGEGYVLLEDGSRFDGELCGAAPGDGPDSCLGEVVFNTAMSGYQEAVTDPSYAGQAIVFTYPMIGNYGVRDSALESSSPHARAVIMREARNDSSSHGALGGWLDWLAERGVPAISGVETRALVRLIRETGSLRGGLFAASTPESEARELIAAEPAMAGSDRARGVTPAAPIEHPGDGPHVVALDTGIKWSIVRNFTERGARVTLLPYDTPAAAVLERDPDLVFLANGPGDPSALAHLVETTRALIGERPVVGICLGHQILSRAVGLETFKLRFGHRGSNHPVKDLSDGTIEITSQNHGFAVAPPGGGERIETDEPVGWETDFGAAELTHLNLYDRTVEGLRLTDVPAQTVQYHPEAGPGPRDARHLFDRFLALAEAG